MALGIPDILARLLNSAAIDVLPMQILAEGLLESSSTHTYGQEVVD